MPKKPLEHAWAIYSLWYVKIDLSQNQYLSISIERPHKELLNALISFEIRHSKLKLWAVPYLPWAFGTSKLTPPRIDIQVFIRNGLQKAIECTN